MSFKKAFNGTKARGLKLAGILLIRKAILRSFYTYQACFCA